MIDINDKLEKFIDNNMDLVNEFYEKTGIEFDKFEDEIGVFYYNIKKEQPYITFNDVCINVINIVLENNCSLMEALEKIFNNTNDEDFTINSAQQYFKEINNIYKKNNNNYDIEYCPENRDKLIEMNLKTVISIAKKYQGLGLSLNELISAGNLGLVIAYDKFDPSRSKLKDNILECIKNLPNKVNYNDIVSAMFEYLTYGDVKKKFNDKFFPNTIYDKKDLEKWVNSNISNAKFNSIATMWIRAYILIEIDNNSRIIKKPKSEIYKDKDKDGAYRKEIIYDIDAPINDDSSMCLGDMIYIEDETRNEFEVSEAYDTFKDGLNKLLEGVKSRDRSIFLKKFGIGLPRPMLPKEIAEQEGLSIARVSQIFQTVIEQMQENQLKYNINSDLLFDAVKKFN